jgi:hypothetical protein
MNRLHISQKQGHENVSIEIISLLVYVVSRVVIKKI